MKIAVIQANIGGIDAEQTTFKLQSIPCDYFSYSEESLPVPIPNLPARMKARYMKMMPHRYLPGYDMYIWLDARFQIASEKFVEELATSGRHSGIVALLHPDRENVFQEVDFIRKKIEEGNEYLTVRYGNQPLERELVFFEVRGMPKEEPLYATGIFARGNNAQLNSAFEDWFLHTIEYSNFDQSMFTYIAWKHQLNINKLDFNSFVKKHVVKRPHIKIM